MRRYNIETERRDQNAWMTLQTLMREFGPTSSELSDVGGVLEHVYYCFWYSIFGCRSIYTWSRSRYTSERWSFRTAFHFL